MSDKELTPGRLIHLYVIMRWGMFRDKPYPNGATTAKEFVADANYDELNIVTKAEEYVNIVENAVNKLFLKTKNQPRAVGLMIIQNVFIRKTCFSQARLPYFF